MHTSFRILCILVNTIAASFAQDAGWVALHSALAGYFLGCLLTSVVGD